MAYQSNTWIKLLYKFDEKYPHSRRHRHPIRTTVKYDSNRRNIDDRN